MASFDKKIDRRDLPAYTLGEAARYLGISESTLRAWFDYDAPTLALMIICGAVLFFCLFVVYAAFSFFTLEGLEFMNIFTDGGREFGRYPFSFYGRDALRVLTYAVPLALVQYYPLLYLLGRETGMLYMLSPLLALLFAVPAYLLWRFGLRRYKSTGS